MLLVVGLAVAFFTNPSGSGQVWAVSAINWTPAAKGVEYARVPSVGLVAREGDSILLARINPALVLFRVYFRGRKGKPVQAWIKEFPSAALIVNANFYRGNGHPLGLVMIDNKIVSQPSGRPGAGSFQVKGEVPQIGPLVMEQVISNQKASEYTEAFEGYPLLIAQGQPISTTAAYDAKFPARRTVIAQDGKGRIVIAVTTPSQVTLLEMTNWLLNSGLDIVTALNLDGGMSSQMMIPAIGDQPELASGIAAVPVVLVAYTR